MNIDSIPDLPWFWIWLGAGLAFAIISSGLLRFSKWQQRRRVGRYAEPQIVQGTGAVKFVETGMKLTAVGVHTTTIGEEVPTGSGAQVLAALTQCGSGVMLPSGADLSHRPEHQTVPLAYQS